MNSVPIENGARFAITVADPAVATDWALIMPVGFVYHLTSVRYQLVTDGTAATRIIQLLLPTGGALDLIIASSSTQILNLTRIIQFIDLFPTPGTSVGSLITAPLPKYRHVHGGETVASATAAMQAGDQISNIQVNAIRWPFKANL